MVCKTCGLGVPESARNCPSCQADVGFPNVRAAEIATEQTALEERVRQASIDAATRNALPVLEDFGRATLTSKCVLCRSLNIIHRLVSSDLILYITFHQEVESGARYPEDNEWDRARPAVDATLFPYYHDKIGFGSLSLTKHGLGGAYGAYTIILKDVMIRHRSTVFEDNSVTFFRRMNHIVKVGEAVPPGFRAVWAQRDKLSMAKLHGRIDESTRPTQYPGILMKAGVTSAEDDFIEVHVFGPIHRTAIDRVVGPKPNRRDPEWAIWTEVERKLREIGAVLEIS